MRWRRPITLVLVLALLAATLPGPAALAHGDGDGNGANDHAALAQPGLSIHPAAAREASEWHLAFRTTAALNDHDALVLHLPPGTAAETATARVDGKEGAITARSPFTVALPKGIGKGAWVNVVLSGVRKPPAGLYSLCLATAHHPQAVCTGAVAVLPDDVPALSYAAGAIAALYLNDKLRGYEDGSFRPDAPMARAEFAKLLAVALQLQLPDGVAPPVFSDVHAGDWFYPYVAAVAGASLLDGVAGGSFAPSAPLDREALAVVLHRVVTRTTTAAWTQRLLSANRWSEAEAQFTDADQVAKVNRQAVGLALGLGLLAPAVTTRLEPQAAVSRAEVAQALYKTLLVQAQSGLLAGDDSGSHLAWTKGCALPGGDGELTDWLRGLRVRLQPLHGSLAALARQAAQLEALSDPDRVLDAAFWQGLKADQVAVALDLVGVTTYLLTCPAPDKGQVGAADLLGSLLDLWLDLDWLEQRLPLRLFGALRGSDGLRDRLQAAARSIGAAGGILLPDYSWWQEWQAADQLSALGEDLQRLLTDLLTGNWRGLDDTLVKTRVRLEVLLLQVEMGGPAPPLYADVAADLQNLAGDTRRALEACQLLRSGEAPVKDPAAAVRYTLRALFALSRLTADLTLAHVQEHLQNRQ